MHGVLRNKFRIECEHFPIYCIGISEMSVDDLLNIVLCIFDAKTVDELAKDYGNKGLFRLLLTCFSSGITSSAIVCTDSWMLLLPWNFGFTCPFFFPRFV